MMKSFSPGLMRPSSRRARCSIVCGSSPKLAGVFPQTGVLPLQLGDHPGQFAVLPISTQDCRESLLADQGVRDEHAGDERQEIPSSSGFGRGTTTGDRMLLVQAVSLTRV